MPRLKEWLFINAMGVAVKPEVQSGGHEIAKTRLFGKVYDDKRCSSISNEFDDGHRVVTSPVFEINWKERYVKTRSGTIYNLEGNPNQTYVEWLEQAGLWEGLRDQLLPPISQMN